ncbi:hypothetical protein VHUM_01793 [Vanrija humicola]|uniref:Aminotransferase class I/classII large domain-containing protein n=1 Tax=Vanrija humicola TaxID=5417 RepID=A0A7D8ZAU4_VANHU|nr:hypothetical protein VHUM_01793 [Vanrija humicola]
MPRFALAPAVRATAAPPIPKAKAWGPVYAASAAARTAPLLDLSQGVPGTPPDARVLAALADVAGTFEAAKYGAILGEPGLRAGLAAELRVKYGLDDGALTADDVAITTGCNMAFLNLLMILCEPNTSSVLIPLPSYFNHAMSLSLQSVVADYIPADPSAGFQPSLAAARAILERGTRAVNGREVTPRAIVLVTPNNPTGAVYAPDTLKQWYTLAQEFNIPLVLDETYRDFVDAPHRLFEEPDWRDTLVTLGSFSKGYRLPGHRLGSITAGPELLQQVATVLDCMQICPPRTAQLAITPLLPALRGDLAAGNAAIAARRSLFERVVSAVPGWRVVSSGGYFAYVQFPAAYRERADALGLKAGESVGSEAVARALGERCGVVTLPGAFFMPPLEDAAVWDAIPEGDALRADQWIRFAIANVSDETIAQLGPRLAQLNALLGL